VEGSLSQPDPGSGEAPAPARWRHGRDIPKHYTAHNTLIRDALIDALSTLNAMDVNLPRDTTQRVLATASGGSASTATNSWAPWCRFRPTSLGIPTASWPEALRTKWMAQRRQWRGSAETQGCRQWWLSARRG
jgi:hypothetical protein